MKKEEERLGTEIKTRINAFSGFFIAEDYHQKYYLQNNPELFKEYTSIYPEISQLTASTAVARVNGYIGGNGKLNDLEKNINSLGLSPDGSERLMQTGARLLS